MVCDEITLTASDIPPGETVTWQYGTGAPFVPEDKHTFDAEGPYDVTMDVTNGSPVTKSVPVTNTSPVSSFDYSPTQPDPGEWIVFESTSTECDIASVAWDFDSGGLPDSTDPEVTHKFDTAGQKSVTLTVTDNDGLSDSETRVVEVGAVPVAAFHRDPPASALLETGQVATFSSDSTASPGGSISALNWDFDGDGFDDGSGASVSHSFAAPGMYVVRLEVEQTNGRRAVAESVFRVNGPPMPGFVWSPAGPLAGGQVELYSTSTDAEGPLAGEAWELDGDGDFNDAFGSSAASTFAAGSHAVSLRVTDGDGVSRTVTRTIVVAAPPVVNLPPVVNPPPTLMSPFPTVRLAGVVLPRGARIGLVEVRGAPRGASVTVRCTGGGCPFRSRRRVAETGRVRLSPVARFLRAGARIEVLVRAPRVIGRWVGFRIRAGKRPVRVDRCLLPGSAEPTRCP